MPRIHGTAFILSIFVHWKYVLLVVAPASLCSSPCCFSPGSVSDTPSHVESVGVFCALHTVLAMSLSSTFLLLAHWFLRVPSTVDYCIEYNVLLPADLVAEREEKSVLVHHKTEETLLERALRREACSHSSMVNGRTANKLSNSN